MKNCLQPTLGPTNIVLGYNYIFIVKKLIILCVLPLISITVVVKRHQTLKQPKCNTHYNHGIRVYDYNSAVIECTARVHL